MINKESIQGVLKRTLPGHLPRAGAERERLRAKGQFWTPDWVADFMAAYALQDHPPDLLDPSMGEGTFFRAAKRFALNHGFTLKIFGRDIDPDVVAQALNSGLQPSDLDQVEIKDFVLDPPGQKFSAIIANPPYIRHHRLPPDMKQALRSRARALTGLTIDGRAGLHVYFLLQALHSLAPGGRLAFIVSADVCEGVFAPSLWQWITSHYRLETVISFTADSAPFPEVDTNALVFLILNGPPAKELTWVRCKERGSAELIALTANGPRPEFEDLEVHHRTIAESLATGLSRPPALEGSRHTLGDFADVVRGIVTGDNDFFFMTSVQARQRDIPADFLVRAIGRTRDVNGELLTPGDMEQLDADGRPTWLLSIDGRPWTSLPRALQEYLRMGEAEGLPEKTLIQTRNPWYRMETRRTPPILFAYLGRRNARFIRNLAGVVPLTCLLCIYPKFSDEDFLERLWKILSHPDTVNNLSKVGKSYGSGAIKVEPRALERLPLPDPLVTEQGLDQRLAPKQGLFNFD